MSEPRTYFCSSENCRVVTYMEVDDETWCPGCDGYGPPVAEKKILKTSAAVDEIERALANTPTLRVQIHTAPEGTRSTRRPAPDHYRATLEELGKKYGFEVTD